jgi:IS5 family transposase
MTFCASIDLTRKLFDEIGISLRERGLLMKEGTLVDATIIEAPPSTKNAENSRDPEMYQTKKGNEWRVSRTQAEPAMLY